LRQENQTQAAVKTEGAIQQCSVSSEQSSVVKEDTAKAFRLASVLHLAANRCIWQKHKEKRGNGLTLPPNLRVLDSAYELQPFAAA